ncbi:hypothetical protein [Halobaculum limi]|nr:hypothetical protein [Halobaculum sp. YSMS11]
MFRTLDSLVTAASLPLHTGGPSTLDVVGYTLGGVILSYTVYVLLTRLD